MSILDGGTPPLNPPSDQSPVRTLPADDIQRAHDVLHAQVTGEVPFVLDESARPLMHAALDALCWVLGHEHNENFGRSLAKIERELAARGFRMVRSDAPFVGAPPAEGGAR